MAGPSSLVTTDPRSTAPVFYGAATEVAPDVFMHAVFVNTYAVRTPVGLLLIDPGLAETVNAIHSAVRAWSNAPLHTAVYTHGHADHAFGLGPFLAAGERPQIVAQENCPRRFRRYQSLHGWNTHINQRQFGLAMPRFPQRFDWPDVLVRDRLHPRRHGRSTPRPRRTTGPAWLDPSRPDGAVRPTAPQVVARFLTAAHVRRYAHAS